VTLKTIKIDLQVLRNHAVVAGSTVAPEGMLILCDKVSPFMLVLNPLNVHVIDLPFVKTFQLGSGCRALFLGSSTRNIK
jgi:hypothetical protein